MDDIGHGTHVAGTIGAVGDNGIGVVGVNWAVSLMAVKFIGSNGLGSSSDAAASLIYASENGARVLNNSWGSEGRLSSDPVVESAIDYAYSLDSTIIFAAGNIRGGDDVMYYAPANYPKTIAVSATNYEDLRSQYSRFGAKIDVAAPGDDILSLKSSVSPMCPSEMTINTNYCRASGTSMAAPHVAGLAALILSKHDFTNEQIRQALRSTADDINQPGVDLYSGAGRINAEKAVALNSVPKAIITSPRSGTDITNADILEIRGTASGPGFSAYSLSYSSGVWPSQWIPFRSSSVEVTNGILGSWEVKNFPTGYYILRLTVTDLNNRSFESYVSLWAEKGLRQLTVNGSDPDVSGDKIVWGEESDIYLFDLATNTKRKVTTNSDFQEEPKIDQNRIVWRDYRNGMPSNPDIYLFDLATNTERQITTNSSQQLYPDISGDKIVWQDYRNGNNDIYLFDLATNTERQITTNSMHQQFPKISGNRIVWQDKRNGNWDIYLYDLSTNTERRITTNSQTQEKPDISGNNIVWQDWRNGNWDIYLYDLSTNTERRITTNPENQDKPTISGNNIVWRDYRYLNPDIYFGNLSSNNERQITVNHGAQWNPVISGNNIVWQDYRDGYPWGIYLYILGDTDQDGFQDNVELYIGTDPYDACPDNPTDHAWPPDFNNSRKVDIVDEGFFRLVFLSQKGDGKYIKRYDLNADDRINILDVGATRPYFNKTCTN